MCLQLSNPGPHLPAPAIRLFEKTLLVDQPALAQWAETTLSFSIRLTLESVLLQSPSGFKVECAFTVLLLNQLTVLAAPPLSPGSSNTSLANPVAIARPLRRVRTWLRHLDGSTA